MTSIGCHMLCEWMLLQLELYDSAIVDQSISNLGARDALSFIDIIYNLSCSASMYVSVYAILHLI